MLEGRRKERKERGKEGEERKALTRQIGTGKWTKANKKGKKEKGIIVTFLLQ